MTRALDPGHRLPAYAHLLPQDTTATTERMEAGAGMKGAVVDIPPLGGDSLTCRRMVCDSQRLLTMKWQQC